MNPSLDSRVVEFESPAIMAETMADPLLTHDNIYDVSANEELGSFSQQSGRNMSNVSNSGRTMIIFTIGFGILFIIAITYIIVELSKLKTKLTTSQYVRVEQQLNNEDVAYLTEQLPQRIMEHVTQKLEDFNTNNTDALQQFQKQINVHIEQQLSEIREQVRIPHNIPESRSASLLTKPSILTGDGGQEKQRGPSQTLPTKIENRASLSTNHDVVTPQTENIQISDHNLDITEQQGSETAMQKSEKHKIIITEISDEDVPLSFE